MPIDFTWWPSTFIIAFHLGHRQHFLHECETSLLCRHERSPCLIEEVYCKECFDFEGCKTVVIPESRSFRSGFVLFPFACRHPSCGAALSVRFEVGGRCWSLIGSTDGELLGKLDGKNGPLRGNQRTGEFSANLNKVVWVALWRTKRQCPARSTDGMGEYPKLYWFTAILAFKILR